MRIDVISIFPDYLAPLELALVGRARAARVLDVRVHDLRHWTFDRHRSVDDTPYGGGAGMVMRPEPWALALEEVVGAHPPESRPVLVLPTPAGRLFDQAKAGALAAEPWIVIGCGRYEGIDQRVIEHASTWLRVEELSVGDYVLAGGEAAALVMIEAVTRLLPGVLGNPASLVEESHVEQLLEYPVYTKPASWRGLDVPAVLLSGHHAEIARWRREVALERTAERRPELLERPDGPRHSPRPPPDAGQDGSTP